MKAHCGENSGAVLCHWSVRGALAAAALMLLSIGVANAQTWKYQSYYNGQAAAPGYVTLTESGGKATLQMVFGYAANCFQGDLDATVTRTQADTTITVPPHLRGCDEFRLVIKNDGTGGRREVKKGAEWVPDKYDRGLTLRK